MTELDPMDPSFLSRELKTIDAQRFRRELMCYPKGDTPCPACGGHGADPGSDNVNWLACSSCQGTGKMWKPPLDSPARAE